MTNKEVIFNNLNFGDIIRAKRKPDPSNISPGHRVGPFLVIGRTDDHLICLYGTSKEKKTRLSR